MRFLLCMMTTVLLFVQSASGQTIDFDKFIPSAPNAASLAKYAATPVSYYTGVPNITIPLYTIQSGSISLPISLSYHAGGIKISEEASSVGLGWTLNAGGAITRFIGYKDDFDLYLGQALGVPDPPLNPQGFFDPSATRVIQRGADCKFPVNQIMTTYPVMPWGSTNAVEDWVPDTFFYNFNGHSGSFWLDRDGNVHQSKKTALSITLLNQADGQWAVKTANGTTYQFQQLEHTYVTQHIGDGGGYISSWYLTGITDHLGNTIEFIYDTREAFSPIRTFTQQFNFSVGTFINLAGKPVSIEGVYLSQIRFKNGRILFNYSEPNERLDIGHSYFIKSMEVYSEPFENNLELVKKIDLNYSYFGNGSGGGSPISGDYYELVSTSDSDPSYRLKLDAVIKNDIEVYSFDYHSSVNAPTKTTFAQDYWGYYNGKGGPPSFIPVSATNPISGVPTVKANRRADANKAKEFTLSKITYPTGGYTIFEHELNTYKLIGAAGGTIPQTVVHVENNASNGGLVEKIVEIAGLGQVNLATTAFVKDAVISGYDDLTGIYSAYQAVGPDDLYVELLDALGNTVEKMTFSQMFDPGATYTSTILGLSNQINVPPGTYTLRSYVNPGHYFVNGNANISVTWEEAQTSPQDNYGSGGGLRIRSISDFDRVGSLALKREFDYHYEEDIAGEQLTSSHGRLMRFPKYQAWFRDIAPQGGTPNSGLQASSSNSLSMEQGSYVGYDQVRVFSVSGDQKNGLTVYKYRNEQDLYFPAGTDFSLIESEFYEFPPIRTPINGLLYEETHYQVASDGQLKAVRKAEHEYHINGIKASEFVLSDLYQNPDYVLGGVMVNFGQSEDPNWFDECDDQSFLFHPYYSNLIRQVSTEETQYDINGEDPLTTRQNFYYDNDIHLQRTRTELIYSNGDTLKTRVYYPDDIFAVDALAEGGALSVTEYDDIIKLQQHAQHRIAQPIQTVTYKADALGNQQLLSLHRNIYKDWGSGLVLAHKIQTAMAGRPLEDHITYTDYDAFGNPLGIVRGDSIPISYIWGYGNTQPVAKLEKIAYGDINPADIDNIQLLSDNDIDAASEQTLRDALEGLRTSYPNAVITSYTYDPMIGVSSISDSRGYVSFYHYDELSRLRDIEDAAGNTAKVFKYNYSQQAPPVYDPLNVDIAYGASASDHQWFLGDISGGSGDLSYSWFEGINASSTDFEGNASGATNSYQLMTNCNATKYVKLVVTDNITGETAQAIKVNNNPCNYTPLIVNVVYGAHSDTHQDFTTMISGGSGNVTYAWYKGIGTSSFTFEVNPSGAGPNYQLAVSCSSFKWVKLVVTDTVTSEVVNKVVKSNNSPCSGGGGNLPDPDPTDPEQ